MAWTITPPTKCLSRGCTNLLGVPDSGEEGLQLQGLHQQGPAHGLVVLQSQAGVGQTGRAQRHHLAQGAHRRLLVLLLHQVLFRSAVALICGGVPGGCTSAVVVAHHALDEAFQLGTELPLLAVVQSPVQGSVNGHTQGLDQLGAGMGGITLNNFGAGMHKYHFFIVKVPAL